MLIFAILIILSILKSISYFFLVFRNKTILAQELNISHNKSEFPYVDIIMPIFNEGTVILKTIEKLLDINYENLSIIIIDDGSTDSGVDLINSRYSNHSRIKLICQNNSGKSSALNKALDFAKGEIVVCIDADTMVKPDILEYILPHFSNQNVAAVSGYIKVGNKVNILTSMQYFEYISIQNHDRIIFEPQNGILVVPGALGAFRRTVVDEVGGFKSDALAEDCDITLRMLCKGYNIKNAKQAVAYTEAPTSTKTFVNQRVRWIVGLLQGLIKHKTQIFNHPNKMLSRIVVPYTWLYRVISPLIVPLSYYYFLYSFLFHGNRSALPYFIIYLLIETTISYYVISISNEKVNFIKLLFLQICLNQLALVTYIFILVRWLNGNLFYWHKIPRKGNVSFN